MDAKATIKNLFNKLFYSLDPAASKASLCEAVLRGNLEEVKMLLDRGANPNEKSELHDGMMPLHYAADIQMIKLLLKRGAKIQQQTDEGDTPLRLAACRRKTEVAAFLIAHGASVNGRSYRGSMPLHAASASGEIPMAELLLSKGANINAIDSHGRTPLYMLCGYRQDDEARCLNMAIWLLNHGANPKILPGGDRLSSLTESWHPELSSLLREKEK